MFGNMNISAVNCPEKQPAEKEIAVNSAFSLS